MKLKLMVLLVFLFSNSLVYGQMSLNNFVTVKLIDSLKFANSYGILGYSSLHLKADGGTVYLAAKKNWAPDGVDTAKIFFGKRVNGNWEFNDILTTNDLIFPSNVQLTLDDLNNPIVFYKDRTFENGWAKDGIINVLHSQNNNWQTYTAITFNNDPSKGEIFESFGSRINPGFVMLESYWSDVHQKLYSAYSVYDYQAGTLSSAVTYNLDSLTEYYNAFTLPAVTEDGEYFAHSCVVPITELSYHIGLFVYKKVSTNQWSLDFEYLTDTLYLSYPHTHVFSVAIGKDSNDDILLLANNDVEHPFFRKTNGVWTKVEDNYPIANGNNSPGASGRPLNNEKIQFASDGTAFWGDIDGIPAFAGGAETSFRTSDGHWGRIYCPPAPGYNWNDGLYGKHDFTITNDDTLIIVYEFIHGNTAYLLEAKVYIPEIVNYVTQISNPSRNFAPNSFTLFQNYPNPFNSTTIISYSVPKYSFVQLEVYDVLGNIVATLVNKEQQGGNYKVTFDASKLASGIYFYSLKSGNFVNTKKLILLR